MREIAHWLRQAKRASPRQLLAVTSASALAVAVVSCIGCLALATVAGTILIDWQHATNEPAPTATEAVRATSDSELPPASVGTDLPRIDEPQPARGTATESIQPNATPMPNSTPDTSGGAASPASGEPSTTLEPPEPLGPADAGSSGALVEPLTVPAPDSSLEFTPTSQLTLSSVIFVENVGQFPGDVRFQVRGALGGGMWLSPDAMWITLIEPATGTLPLPTTGAEGGSEVAGQRGIHLKLNFVGANPSPSLVPFNALDTYVSYFFGNNPTNWRTEVPVWGGVRYQELYPGIDLELTSEAGQPIQRLVIHPNADLNAVRLQVDGAQALSLEPLPSPGDGTGGEEKDSQQQLSIDAADLSSGQVYLRLGTALGDFSLPLFRVVTSDSSLLPSPPPAPHLIEGGNVVEFPFFLPNSDQEASLPGMPASLLYATTLGQGGNNASYALAVDPAGRAYVTGYTYVPGFPLTAGVFDAASSDGTDAFVLKLKANGSEMAYLTFFGGSGNEGGYSLALDSTGNAYFTGVTDSSDLPTTAGAFGSSQRGGFDSFVAKLNVTGSELAYATYLGGSEDDWSRDIAVDEAGNAYVVGATLSQDFPATTGAWDTSSDGHDAFVVKVNALGTGLAYATFLGGTGADQAAAIALDEAGCAFVAGSTQSPDFPVTVGVFDSSHDGDWDAFVAEVTEAGTGLAYATFLGGSKADLAQGIALDREDNAFVAGSTQSPDFPTTPWGFDVTYGGGEDAFVAKVKAGGAELGYASFVGGTGQDNAQSLAVDDMGYAYVTGSTRPAGTPEVSGTVEISASGQTDAFVVRVSELGTELAYAAPVGGSGQDLGLDIAVDRLGSAYVVGVSGSPDFAAGAGVSGFVPEWPANVWDAFVAKLAVGTPFLDLPVSYSNFAQAALGNMDDRGPGRVNSWFDHSYPDHTQNRKLVRWDGTVIKFDAATPPLIGESWYDGHGGTDFRWEVRDEPIYAAAPGTVINTVSTCRVGNPSCGNSFGNRVWIDHGNGYATVYAHLQAVYVTEGTVINDPAAQPLGTMGNTGRSLGTHLHFALYFDRNGDGQWTKDEVLDPYGWSGPGQDPWSGPNEYLWKHPLVARQVAGDADLVLESPSSLVTATVPAGAFGTTVLVELGDLPSETLKKELPAAESPALWRSTGHSFRLVASRLQADGRESQLDGGGMAEPNPGLESVDVPSLPITVRVAFRAEELLRLDPSQLAIRRWDEDRQAWVTLPTTVDSSRHEAIAQTTELGQFDLHAPLLCAADSQEPDDHYGAAQPISASGAAVKRGFDTGEDVDWFRLDVKAGDVYVAQTSGLAKGVSTVMRLRDPDTLGLRASSDSRRGEGEAYLRWKAPEDGSVLLEVSRPAGGAYGCEATYGLTVKQVIPLGKVVIAGPKTSVVEMGSTFTATISPIAASQPISFAWQLEGESHRIASLPTGESISCTWTTTGTHQVLVTATNEAGAVTGTVSVFVYGPLSAAFSALPLSGQAPLEVAFANMSSEGYTESWWNFGDGRASREESPSHTYKAAGVYTVTLTVAGPGGRDLEAKAAYITVKRENVRRGGEYTVFLPIAVRRR
jgi:murein DD-endopeptidase MepM/ murein hydrolase activator NlpD